MACVNSRSWPDDLHIDVSAEHRLSAEHFRCFWLFFLEVIKRHYVFRVFFLRLLVREIIFSYRSTATGIVVRSKHAGFSTTIYTSNEGGERRTTYRRIFYVITKE